MDDGAHELSTPLTTLDGYLEGLENGVIQRSEPTWKLLRGETARLSRLVNDLHDLWRADARQLSLATCDGRCHGAARRSRATIARQAESTESSCAGCHVAGHYAGGMKATITVTE